jgi:hypothetical protein
VNAHALSHLFDADSNQIEHCQTCDEFNPSASEDIEFIPQEIQSTTNPLQLIELQCIIITDISNSVVFRPVGQYFNKPPPSA